MAKYKDTCDLYDDQGKLLKSGVALEKVSPLNNAGILKIIDLTKRTVAVNLAGLDNSIKTGAMGGKNNQILGRAVKVDCVKDADTLSAKIAEYVSVNKGDDTKITKVGGGKMLLVEVPSARLKAAATYDAATTSVAAATTQALIASTRSACTMLPMSSRQSGVPTLSRWTWPAEHHLGALHSPKQRGSRLCTQEHPCQPCGHDDPQECHADLCSVVHLEQAGEFEMGMAIGPFERAQLLAYAFQGLNANNMVYDIVKANGKTGTIGTVVQSLVERAIEDKVIKAGKRARAGMSSTRQGPMMWNAYACAGTMAATMVNCGAGRFAQAVSSVLLYFNDLLEHETGLTSADYGRVMGTAVGFSFFSHSITVWRSGSLQR